MCDMNHCNPWHPAPLGYGNLALQNIHAFICPYTYMYYTYIIHIYIHPPHPPKINKYLKTTTTTTPKKPKNHPQTPKKQTKTWTYTKNKALQTITATNPLLKCWHPTWIAKEGRVKQLLFLFQTSWGRLINCVCVSQWKASNQLCNM